MSKIKQNRNFTIVEKKPTISEDNSNKQGVSKFVENPSNGQDDEVKHGKRGSTRDASDDDEEKEDESKNSSYKLDKMKTQTIPGSMPNNLSMMHAAAKNVGTMGKVSFLNVP